MKSEIDARIIELIALDEYTGRAMVSVFVGNSIFASPKASEKFSQTGSNLIR